VRCTVGQCPEPSQVVTSVSVEDAHVASPHEVVFGALWQALASVPLQLRPHTGSLGLALQAG
jgi:hypothetical protein